MKAVFYWFVSTLFRGYNHLYFRRVEVVGKEYLPKAGSLLFSPNHQGAFLDPIVLGSILSLPITYLTRGDVFGGRLQWFLDALRTLPVYRIRNGFSSLKQNDNTFERCYKILAKGEHLMMFSEGLHHAEYYLHPLSKGSSRLMYQAQQKHPQQPMYIVPVGINYGNYTRPFGVLQLVIGPPIAVKDYLNEAKTPAQNINALRDALIVAMKKTLWIPEKGENYLTQEALLHPKNTRLPFHALQKGLHESPSPLYAPPQWPFYARSVVFMGYAAHFLPFLGLKKVLELFADKVFHNSIKYVFGLLILPLWWALCAFYTVRYLGWAMALAVVCVQILLLYSRQYLLLYKKQ